jgi:tetratricopeptide (TPR) repeat protein
MALRHFAALRERLIDELGVEPGADVRAAHLAVLRGELQEPRSEHAAPVNVAPAVSASAVVAQLPLDSRGFVGRADELAQLDAATATARNQPTAATVWVVIGSAGVGKTALAVHWAHRVADQFPDGQLYMNLRGFDPGESPMTPEEAIRGFLDALHVPAYIPPDPEMQAALYRSYLAGKRVLIVLDNAAGAAQVRPLLPGGPTCLVVITSRNQLTSLITREGAHALTLNLLTPQEAAEFLAGRLGHGRIVAEPDAAADIVAHCSRLPLALAMVAARAATRPHFLLRTIAAELRGEPWLDAFRGEDPDTDIRAVFSWSYRRLALPTARLFRLLGLHPGTDISVPAAASLTGCPAVTARQRLEELVRASLLTEYRPGGYTLHDLLRAYAVDLTHSLDSDNAREAALHRLLEHYERTAHTADQVLNPYHDYREPVVLPGPRPEVASEEVVDAERALTWFSAESPTLRRAIALAAGTGRDALAWNLAHSLAIFLDRQGRKDELAATQLDALDAATRRSDSGGQAVSHLLLGRALMWMGRRDEAHPHLTRAAQLHEATGRELGLARSHVDLALLALQTGQFNHAKDQAERSVRLYEANGNEGGRAGALSTLGWCRAYLGDYHRALRDCRQALVLAQRIGDVRSESWAWKGLGHSNQQLGDHQQAIECYRQASGLFRALADRFSEFDVRNRLGDCHFAAGHLAAAGAAWRLALELFVDIEHPEADKVRSKLENLDRPA